MGLDNPLHILFLVVILLLVFGAKRLPEIGRSLGTGMREFKHSVTGEDHHPQQTSAPLAAPQPVQAAAVAQTPQPAPAQAPPAAQPVQAPAAPQPPAAQAPPTAQPPAESVATTPEQAPTAPAT